MLWDAMLGGGLCQLGVEVAARRAPRAEQLRGQAAVLCLVHAEQVYEDVHHLGTLVLREGFEGGRPVGCREGGLPRVVAQLRQGARRDATDAPLVVGQAADESLHHLPPQVGPAEGRGGVDLR